MNSINIIWNEHNLTISTESNKEFESIVRNSFNNALSDTKRVGVIVDHLRGVLRDVALLESFLIDIDGCYFGYNMPVALLPISCTDFDIYVKGTFSVFTKELDGRKYLIYHTWLDEDSIDNIEFEKLIEYYRDGKTINLLEEFYGITEVYDVYLIIKDSKELIGAGYSHVSDDDSYRIREMAGSDFVMYESTFSESVTPEDLGLATGIQIPIIRKVNGRNRVIRSIDFTGFLTNTFKSDSDSIKDKISQGYSSYVMYNNDNKLKLKDDYLKILVD